MNRFIHIIGSQWRSKRLRTWRCLPGVLLVVLLPAFAVLAAEAPENSEEVQEIILLHTNDLHFDFNYLDAVTDKIARFRAQYDDVFLLDAGDFSNRESRWRDGMGPEEYAEQLTYTIDTMNALDYQAATLGNHELGYFQTVTRDILRQAQFPILGANVTVDTENFDAPQPYTLLETSNGTSLAILGLCGGGYDNAEGITLEDAAETLDAYLYLREENEVFVLLTHIGYTADIGLAGQYDEAIDVIVGGHTHTQVNPPGRWNGVLVAQTGGHPHNTDPERRQYLGVVYLELRNGEVAVKEGEVLEFNASGHTQSQFLELQHVTSE